MIFYLILAIFGATLAVFPYQTTKTMSDMRDSMLSIKTYDADIRQGHLFLRIVGSAFAIYAISKLMESY